MQAGSSAEIATLQQQLAANESRLTELQRMISESVEREHSLEVGVLGLFVCLFKLLMSTVLFLSRRIFVRSKKLS